MKICLSNSNKVTYVDKVDKELAKFDWRISPDGYARVTINGKRWFMHRYIMQPPKDKEVDHKDGNRLNNRRRNLRICTRRENAINSCPMKSKVYSKYKGVTYCSTEKRRKKWSVNLEINNKSVYVGRYLTEEEAKEAYNKKAKELFGEFAWLNK